MEKPKSLMNLVRRNQVTSDQADWFVNALNPFADYRQTPAGVPSDDTFQTAVKSVQKTMTIGKPVGLPAGATWDLVVCNLPIDAANLGLNSSNCFFGSTDLNGNTTLTKPGGVDTQFGTLMASSIQTGGNPIPWSSSFAITSELNFLSLNDAWAGEGSMRIAAFGFEVVDVSPALYRGGTLTAFRQESAGGVDFFGTVTGTTAVAQDKFMTHFAGYPRDLSECMRIPGSLQWGAEEGSYHVCTFDEHLREFESPTPQSVFTTAGTTLGQATQNTFVAGMDSGVTAQSVVKTHLDMSGSYLSGLNESAVITITLHAVVEIVPRTSSVMIDFVKPGVPGNSRLMSTYATVKNDLPAAVVKDDNDAGDFFKTMVNLMTPALSVAFPEFSPLIGGAGYLANKGISALEANHKKKKQAQKQKHPQTQALGGAKRPINNMQVKR